MLQVYSNPKWDLMWTFLSDPACSLHQNVKCTLDKIRLINSSPPGQNDIFKCIFVNENTWLFIKISLKFVPKGQFNNNIALVQKMAWRRIVWFNLKKKTQFETCVSNFQTLHQYKTYMICSNLLEFIFTERLIKMAELCFVMQYA